METSSRQAAAVDDSGDAAQDASSAAPNNTTPTNLPESHEGVAGQQNRTTGSHTPSLPIVLLKRLCETNPCSDKTKSVAKPHELVVEETRDDKTVVGIEYNKADRRLLLGDSSISIKSSPGDFDCNDDECYTDSHVVDTLIDFLQSENGDQEPQTIEQHNLNEDINVTEPCTMDKESSTKGKSNTKGKANTKGKSCTKGKISNEGKAPRARGNANSKKSSNKGKTTRINTMNINEQKTYAMTLRQRRLSNGKVRAVTAKKLQALKGQLVTANINPSSEFSIDERLSRYCAQINKTNKKSTNKRGQTSDPFTPDMIFAAPSYPKRICVPLFLPDPISKRLQILPAERVAGPSGLQNTILEPVAASSGLQRVTTEPVAGPSGLQRVTTEPVARPSGLQRVTTEQVAGPSGPQKVISAPVAGPSGLQRVTTEPVGGPTGVQMAITEPVAGPSGLPFGSPSNLSKYISAQKRNTSERLQGIISKVYYENNPEVAHLVEQPRPNVEAPRPQANVEMPRAAVQSRIVDRHIIMLNNVYREGDDADIEANSDDQLEQDDYDGRGSDERISDDDLNESSADTTQTHAVGGVLHEGPVFRPTKEEFQNPMAYFMKIWDEACEIGICKVIPPPGWRPTSQSSDGLRFDIQRLYVSRILNRWGSSMRELACMKFCASRTNGSPCNTPTIGGMEVNLPKLYHSVQRHGGLQHVIGKKYWGRVARDMNLSTSLKFQNRLKYVYARYLLHYDSLSPTEGQVIFGMIEKAWSRKIQRLLDRALNPLRAQRRLMGLTDTEEEPEEHSPEMNAVKEAEDCIVRGPIMNYSRFKELAESTYSIVYGYGITRENNPLSLDQKEELYWRYVVQGNEHVCVATAAIDTGSDPSRGNSRTLTLKNISQNKHNILRFLGPVSGLTAPTLNLGMAFSTNCFYLDPHAVSSLDLLYKGDPRIWYAIPAKHSKNFRKAVSTLCPSFCQRKSLWLSPNTVMIPPQLLREYNVSVTRVVQEENEIILAFPYCYTSSINTGYSESESMNFAPVSWLHSAYEVFKEARENGECTTFSLEELLVRIGKASDVDRTTLMVAQPIFDKILRNELTNRLILQERGMKMVHRPEVHQPKNTGRRRRRNRTFIQEECEYCRATLFFSKVVGLVRNSYLCLEHALKLLTVKKMPITEDMQIVTKVTIEELNNINDDMKRRIENGEELEPEGDNNN
ncbi:protein Jumonji isoform X3 [Spodoptera frugiperda]|uniref:Protein Jumonji isoform X3 n=1 Tax=Spodoptera frugiperda TaxID=7108 RepID=A0A9R0EG46_SPOFR|nr:protein Jumonji isoform X3 [Spodoptera frugiperda]